MKIITSREVELSVRNFANNKSRDNKEVTVSDIAKFINKRFVCVEVPREITMENRNRFITVFNSFMFVLRGEESIYFAINALKKVVTSETFLNPSIAHKNKRKKKAKEYSESFDADAGIDLQKEGVEDSIVSTVETKKTTKGLSSFSKIGEITNSLFSQEEKSKEKIKEQA